MIPIEKGIYVSRVWFLYKVQATFDVLMDLHRQLPDGPWVLQYRFRYYRDHEVFDSKDEKSFWTATLDSTIQSEAQAIRKVAPVLARLKAMTRLDCDVIVIESDEPRVIMHQMSQCRHFHMRFEDKTN